MARGRRSRSTVIRAYVRSWPELLADVAAECLDLAALLDDPSLSARDRIAANKALREAMDVAFSRVAEQARSSSAWGADGLRAV